MRVRIFQDLEALSRGAAELFSTIAKRSITRRKKFAVALSGGHTPRILYSLLGSSPYSENIDWKQTHVFWADERCVPPSHEESNYKLIADELLSKINMPEDNIHRIRGEEEPGRAAVEYEEELHKFFGVPRKPVFDLVVLGAGEDGHTASLFPGSVALREKERTVVPVYLEKPRVDRVTLTLPVFNHAANALFLVSGNAKADVVYEILKAENQKQHPAGLVRPIDGTLHWFTDKAAASRL